MLANIFTAEINQLIGIVIVVSILLYALLILFSRFQRLFHENRIAAIQERILKIQLHILQEKNEFIEQQQTLTWNGTRKFSIVKKQMEAKNICSFYLKPHDGQTLPPFKPGQYLTFNLNLPDRAKPLVRCYSLSDCPSSCSNNYRVTIKKVLPPPKAPDAPSGLSSSFFHDVLQEGDILDIKAPNGAFYLEPHEDNPVVFIAGGIGITPLLSMLNEACAIHSEREMWFFYGIVNGEDHVHKEHLAALDKENENVHLHVVYSRPNDNDAEGVDYQHHGHVSIDLLKSLLPSSNYNYYLCGPPPMMESMLKGLEEWNVPKESIHYEAFGPASAKAATKKPKEAEMKGADAQAFEINFTRSNKVVHWTTGSGTLLEVAEENGVEMDFGCRAGGCGTCLVALRSGSVEYEITPEATVEKGSCLACIAIPKENLEVDS